MPGSSDDTMVLDVYQPPTPGRPARRTIPVRTVVRATGEVLLTLGLVILLFAGYEVWGKAAIINDHQNQLNSQLAQDWDGDNPTVGPSASSGPITPPPGGSIARMYLPSLHEKWVVVQGVDLADIRFAPGHYPDTALPGQIGNFSVAGHRTPAIFWDLDKIHAGDQVIVETKDHWYIYNVYEQDIVSPHAVEVVAPVPGKPGAKPTEADLTLTTCNPKWDNYQRLIIHAKLASTLPHSTLPPGVWS